MNISITPSRRVLVNSHGPWALSGSDLSSCGYVHLPAGLIGVTGATWLDFHAHWDGMAIDSYLSASHYRRERRYRRLTARLTTSGDLVTRLLPEAPFVQRTQDNPRFDGVPRHFEPCSVSLVNDIAFRDLLAVDLGIIGDRDTAWDVGIHQMRVMWGDTDPAEATPEGRHSDGHQFVAIHLIGLTPSMGGISRVFASRSEPEPVMSLRLEQPGDTLILDDRKVLHEVTSIIPVCGAGSRDVLVLDFNRPGATIPQQASYPTEG